MKMKTKPDFEQTSSCPHCGHKMDTGLLSPAEDESANLIPGVGDLGVCIACAGFLVYTDDRGSVRKMTPRDLAGLDPETRQRVVEMRLSIKAMLAQLEDCDR